MVTQGRRVEVRGTTDLEHQLPDERIGQSLIQVALNSGGGVERERDGEKRIGLLGHGA